ncbi:MAG: plastocyanin/azurin family copper-binding protein [Gemmatimonadetes bacterium]|nr:plastocyanin/azurin family copper-binding protein [Gemmatimonadota bacterium]
MERREFVRVIVGAVGALGLTACGSDDPVGGGANPPPAPPPPPPPTGADVNFQIEDNAFVDPAGGRNADATVTIDSGQTVGWVHVGANTHTVTSTSVPNGAQAFDSGNLSNDDTFTVTLTVAGTYEFRCEIHPATMRMSTIIVQ